MNVLTLGQVIDSIQQGQVAIALNQKEILANSSVRQGSGIRINEDGYLVTLTGRKIEVRLDFNSGLRGKYILLSLEEYNAIVDSAF